ncbi:AraC-like DNA-binding protein [Pseudomonas alcaligenes]|nr:AraC-like DNA-binding protein [Pseudomonas alcaligenes]
MSPRPRSESWPQRLLSLVGSPAGIAASYVESLLPAAAERGLDVRELLRVVDIPAEQLALPGYRLPLFKAFALLLQAERLGGDPLIGLRLGLAVRPRSFQVLGYSAMSCATLGEAIQRLQRFEQLVWDIGETRLEEEGEQVALTWRPRLLPWVPRQAVEMALAGWLAFGRWLSDGRAQPLQVEFRHRLDTAADVYAEVLGCPVQGGGTRNAVIFHRALLQTPLRETDPHLRSLMDAQGEACLAAYRLDANLANEVRAALCTGLAQGQIGLDDVAGHLGLTARILRRRLGEAGLALPGLLDEVRKDLAQLYLQHTDFALLEIAYLLGFAEQSSFSRAFRRWTGLPPTAFRRGKAAEAP